MRRRQFLSASVCAMTVSLLGLSATAAPKRKPNFIIILCDDLGYGDIGAMGGKIPTPNIDRMAREGTVLTDYYAPANICTPSRASLLTGRYAVRTGLGWQVIMQGDKRALPLSEVTIPQALKPAGYASALIGKWHLGHVAPSWPPTQHGFDLFFGIPYSHDQLPIALYTDDGPGTELKQEPVVFAELQQRFYARAEKFIEDNADKPFFLELALSAPHLPNDPDAKFRNRSPEGAYGDEVEEVDDIVGRLNARLKSLGIERDTLVIFTSDNGPWYEGSTGGLRERKGGAGYDGGYRVPFIAKMPGTIPAGKRVGSIAMGIDFLPTFCAMAGVPDPAGVELDGKDISTVLTKGDPSPHDELLLFDNEDIVGLRTQRWKYVAAAYYHGYLLPISGWVRGITDSPQLYDMSRDNSENYSASTRHADVVTDMQARLARARAQFEPFRTRKTNIIPVPATPATTKTQD
jgi:arylsulfatase A